MKINPFADKFPMLVGEEWETFKTSILATKGNEQPIEFRMKDGEEELLDGRNRLQACQELGIEPFKKEVFVNDHEVKDYIIRRNLHRRHLTIEMRQAIVAELRADGESTRQIAGVLGVSHTTVKRDLDNSVGTFVPPESKNIEEPEKITGSDGKTYPATKAKKRCLSCESSIRKNQELPKKCPDCAELNKKKKKPTLHEQIEEVNAKDPEPEIEETIEEKIKGNNSRIESFCRSLDKFAKDNCPSEDAWLDHQDRKAGALRKVHEACETLRTCKCSHECPACKGEGCKDCLKTGRVPKWKYDMMV